MDDDLEKLVANVEALHLHGDDALVLTCPHSLSNETAERLRAQLEPRFPGRTVLVLFDGMRLDVLGQHRQLQRIEQSLAGVANALQSVLKLLSDGEDPVEARTLDGDLFSTRERDQSQPL